MNRRTTIRLLGNDYVPKNKEEMKKSEDKTQVKPQQRGNQPPPRK
jgi:hypothetical protein